MDRIGDVLSLKDAAFDICFGEDRRFIDQFQLSQRPYKIEIARAVRFGYPLKFALDKDRAERVILG